MDGQWCTIESDPNIFRELAVKLGVSNVQFEEIIDFDFAKDTLARHDKVFGYIFLFKWTGGLQDDKQQLSDDSLLFIKQNVTNSCATIAILHLSFNVLGVQFNDDLKGFKEFITELPADMRGMALTNSESIRSAHNSFISFGSINADSDDKTAEGDAFHFVALLPRDNKLMVLDGMAEEPYIATIGENSETDMDIVMKYVKKKIGESDGEIRFSLLAMVPDLLQKLKEQLKDCTDELFKADLQAMISEEERRRRRVEPKPVQEKAEGDLTSKDMALLAQALALASQLKTPYRQ